MNDEQ